MQERKQSELRRCIFCGLAVVELARLGWVHVAAMAMRLPMQPHTATPGGARA